MSDNKNTAFETLKAENFTVKDLSDNGFFNNNQILVSAYEVRKISGGSLIVPLIKIKNTFHITNKENKGYINNTNFIIYKNSTSIEDFYDITSDIIEIFPNRIGHVFIKYKGLNDSISILKYDESLQKRIMNKTYSIQQSDALIYGAGAFLREIKIEIFKYFLSFNNKDCPENFEVLFVSYSKTNNLLIAIDTGTIFEFKNYLMNMYMDEISSSNPHNLGVMIFDLFSVDEQDKISELREFMNNKFKATDTLQDVIDFYNANPYRSSGKIDLGGLDDIKLD